MPWPLKVACWWFVLLTSGVCSAVAFDVTDGFLAALDYETLLFIALGSGQFVALGTGFVFGICRGQRAWVESPYLLIGLMVTTGCVLSFIENSTSCGWVVCSLAGTAIPLVLMELPASRRWFASRRRTGEMGLGCGFILVALVVLVLLGQSACPPKSRNKMLSANASRMKICGGAVLWALEDSNRANEMRLGGADLNSCSNSIEFLEVLSKMVDASVAANILRESRSWSIAVNLPADAPDTFPMMISANVDPRIVPREWDGKTGKEEILEMVPLKGAEPLKGIGNGAIVIMRKDGVGQVIRRRSLKRGRILGVCPYRLGEDVYFLTPVGKVRLDR